MQMIEGIAFHHADQAADHGNLEKKAQLSRNAGNIT